MIYSVLLSSAALSLAQAWEVPEKESAVVNPLEVSPEVLAAGEASYRH